MGMHVFIVGVVWGGGWMVAGWVGYNSNVCLIIWKGCKSLYLFKTTRTRQNGRYFADDILNWFSSMNIFYSNLSEMCSRWSDWDHTSVANENGLGSNRWVLQRVWVLSNTPMFIIQDIFMLWKVQFTNMRLVTPCHGTRWHIIWLKRD